MESTKAPKGVPCRPSGRAPRRGCRARSRRRRRTSRPGRTTRPGTRSRRSPTRRCRAGGLPRRACSASRACSPGAPWRVAASRTPVMYACWRGPAGRGGARPRHARGVRSRAPPPCTAGRAARRPAPRLSTQRTSENEPAPGRSRAMSSQKWFAVAMTENQTHAGQSVQSAGDPAPGRRARPCEAEDQRVGGVDARHGRELIRGQLDEAGAVALERRRGGERIHEAPLREEPGRCGRHQHEPDERQHVRQQEQVAQRRSVVPAEVDPEDARPTTVNCEFQYVQLTARTSQSPAESTTTLDVELDERVQPLGSGSSINSRPFSKASPAGRGRRRPARPGRRAGSRTRSRAWSPKSRQPRGAAPCTRASESLQLGPRGDGSEWCRRACDPSRLCQRGCVQESPWS